MSSKPKRIIVLSLVGALASCTHSSVDSRAPARQTSGSPARTSARGAPAKPKTLVLFYDKERAASGFPSPFVRAKVNGVPGVFLVDTGAMIHLLSKEYASKLSAAVQKTKVSASDSTGTKVRLGIMVGSLRLESFYHRKKEAFFVTALPPSFSKNKIDGILSPQLLHKTGMSLVLNLQRPSLSFVQWQQFIRDKSPKLFSQKRVTACVNPKSKLHRLFAVEARVAGKAVKLLLDSGASSVQLRKKAATKLGLLAKARDVGESSSGIGGKKFKSLIVPNTIVQFAGRQTKLDLRISPAKSGCPSDGILGMKLLRNCVIAFEMEQVAIVCNAGSQPHP